MIKTKVILWRLVALMFVTVIAYPLPESKYQTARQVVGTFPGGRGRGWKLVKLFQTS